uniref:Putative isac anti-complement n=1 Tax=Ixodes ricinus TaxID=34613 RepID=A0A0K8RBT4_IXORI
MKVTLIRTLLGTAFVCMQLCQCESALAYNKNFYARVLGSNPGICGAWFRSPNKTEEIMKCVLENVPPPVKDQWTKYMVNNSLTIPQLVSEMCDLQSIMPSSFTYYGNLTKEYNNKANNAGIECTANITGWTTRSPSRVRGSRSG